MNRSFREQFALRTVGRNSKHTSDASLSMSGDTADWGGQYYIYGTSGDDKLVGTIVDDSIHGGYGDDTLDGGTGTDILDGGEGLDIASYARALTGIMASLTTGGVIGDAAGDTYVGIEGLEGSNYGDVLIGDDRSDTASYLHTRDGVVASLASGGGTVGAAAGDIYFSIENLEGSAYADWLSGDAGNNILSGRDGDDVLVSGSGNDTLNGGAGSDVYAFTSALDAVSNVDQIADFAVGEDKIHLDSNIFSTLADGALDPSQFVIGGAATQPGQHIIYNGNTGQLFYDADGSGAEAPLLFATLTPHLDLSANDFLVV